MMPLKDTGIWNFFKSVRLTIILLIVLAAIALIGTLIPQGKEGLRIISRWNPTLVEFLFKIGFLDVYHSSLFRLLLLALALNLVVCSLDRLPKSMRLYRHNRLSFGDTAFERPLARFRTKALEHSSAQNILRNALRLFGGRPEIKQEGSSVLYGFSQYGKFSYFGVYLVHLSVLLILLGGLIGSFLGFEGYVNILEGDTIEDVELRDGNGHVHLGFKLKCDKFFVDFYPNGTPKEYRSTVTLFLEDRPVLTKDILVNHPLEFYGIRFYQASYGKIPAAAILKVQKDDLLIGEIPVELGKQTEITDGITVEVLDMKADLMNRFGPALLLRISNPDMQPKEVWLFKNPNALDSLPEQMRKSERFNTKVFLPYKLQILDVKEKYYTGLQVSKDPGVIVVWFGFALMIFGFFVTFFYPHRQILIRLKLLSPGELEIVARTNKDPAGLESKLERVLSYLKKEISLEG
jgi:cytochrome c biogenesis protein